MGSGDYVITSQFMGWMADKYYSHESQHIFLFLPCRMIIFQSFISLTHHLHWGIIAMNRERELILISNCKSFRSLSSIKGLISFSKTANFSGTSLPWSTSIKSSFICALSFKDKTNFWGTVLSDIQIYVDYTTYRIPLNYNSQWTMNRKPEFLCIDSDSRSNLQYSHDT